MLYRFHDFDFDAERLELLRAGQPLKADALVLRLLHALVRRAGQLVSKRELIDEVWQGRTLSENVITVTMARLRKTLGEHDMVANVHGRGYRFVSPVLEHDAQAALKREEQEPGALFVGRSPVMERLSLALREATARRGSVCLVTGDAGIGKTRVAEELTRIGEASGFSVIWAHCQAAGQTPPLWPFLQIVRVLMENESRRPGDAGSLYQDLVQLVPGLSSAEQPRGAGPALGFDADAKHRAFDAVTRALAETAEQAPCLFVIDDLHWADAASLELLRFWVERCARTRVLILATSRTPEVALEPSHQLAEVLGHRNCLRVALPPLEQNDVQTYVRSVLPDPDGAFARAVLHKSEGNPFYMVELTRALREAELPEEASLRVPDAALELLRQRVRALDASARGVLSAAAVIGRTFELGLLAALTERDASSLMASLDAALASAVIRPVREAKTCFAFGHELLKDVLYEGLGRAQRRALHGRLAQLLASRARDDAALLAHHHYHALPDGDPRLAVQYATLAAGAAVRGYAYADAVRSFGRAREALSLLPNPNAGFDLFLLMSQTLCARVSRSDAFERLVHELIQLAQEQKADETLAQATLLLSPHPGLAVVPGAGGALRKAIASMSEERPALLAALWSRLAILGPLAFDKAQSRPLIERGAELARSSGLLLAQHTAVTAQLYALGGPDHTNEAQASLQEIERLCRENPQLLTVPPLLLELHRTIRALQDGRVAEAEDALERMEQRARIIDSQELFWHAQRFRALLAINRGDEPAQAVSLAQLHQRAARDKILGASLLALYDQVVVLGQHKLLSQAELTCLRSDEDDPPGRWALKLHVLSRTGSESEARRTLARVSPGDLAKLPCDRDYLGTLGSVSHAVLAIGAREYAEALIPLLTPYAKHFSVHSALLVEGAIPQHLGALALLLGRRGEARAQLALAVKESERAQLARSAAEARSLLASCSAA